MPLFLLKMTSKPHQTSTTVNTPSKRVTPHRKVYILITLKLRKDGGTNTFGTFKAETPEQAMELSRPLLKESFDTCYIKVTYPKSKEYFNDGTYKDYDSAVKALLSFTSQKLIKELS